MKKCFLFILMIVVGICIAMNVSAEKYTDIITLRNQALNSWNKSYMDDYGRIINVNVQPIIDEIDKVPVLIMDSPVISDDNIYNALDSKDIVKHEDSVAIAYTYNKNNEEVNISIASQENPLYPTPECADIDISYRVQSNSRDYSPNLIIYDGFYSLPYEINFDKHYLGEEELTPRESLDLAQERLKLFFPDYNIKLKIFRFGIVNAEEPYYSFAIRQSIYDIPILMCSKDPVLNAGEEKLGFKPPKEWNSQRLKYGTFDKPSWILKISKNRFDILCRPLKERQILEDDVPLCNMNDVIEHIEEKIRTGYIRNIYSLRFGFCCFFDKNNEIILYPIWEIECDYMFNPKKDMAVYEENKENPITSRLYYRTMMVNAQTGEFIDPVELKDNLLFCPDVITWEDIK